MNNDHLNANAVALISHSITPPAKHARNPQESISVVLSLQNYLVALLVESMNLNLLMNPSVTIPYLEIELQWLLKTRTTLAMRNPSITMNIPVFTYNDDDAITVASIFSAQMVQNHTYP